MQMSPDEVRALSHRPLFNLLSQIIGSVGQAMPSYYMQRPDGSMVDMLDGANGCAAYVSRQLNVMNADQKLRLIDGQHGTVSSTVSALLAAGWVRAEGAPKPGDVIVWERQQQADGEHTHIGFSLGNSEAVSTNYIDLVVYRHPDDRNALDQPRGIDQVLRYPWPIEEYDALAHLNVADGSAV